MVVMLTTMVTSTNSCSFLLVSMMNSLRVSTINVAIKDWKGQSSWYASIVGGLDYTTM